MLTNYRNVPRVDRVSGPPPNQFAVTFLYRFCSITLAVLFFRKAVFPTGGVRVSSRPDRMDRLRQNY